MMETKIPQQAGSSFYVQISPQPVTFAGVTHVIYTHRLTSMGRIGREHEWFEGISSG
ncbi:hypothetical protein PRECH8_14050 [Insulibacter thermoxylanivorax]|uniref:Uncharacterized protein n=1 Tax=Insulibacter thermoxylanivorax TaxID=2749268 RepID=A0A916QFS6_9BACL|nr:hypothetical protein PRECH8_14050 [Insulibacter thermoxylanivorax]